MWKPNQSKENTLDTVKMIKEQNTMYVIDYS